MPVTKKKPSATRSHKQVEASLRRLIVSGEWRPGSRLPNRVDIERRFGVSMPTVQKALDSMVHDGFVHARPGAGTFVADRPPHLCQYGLVFPDPAYRSQFYSALRLAAGRAAEKQCISITEYFHHDVADHQRLSDDVANHRLAGVVFVHPQWDLWDSLAVQTPGVPRVVIAGASKHGIPAIDVDMASFYRRAVDLLVSRGRRRLAVMFPESPHPTGEQFLKEISARSLESRPYWLCTMAREFGPAAVETSARLLFELGDDKRPDGLVIVDDNLLAPALCGVMASPMRVPEQLEIVSHCNYPLPPGGKLPITRLGFDCQEFINLALQCLERQRQDERCPRTTFVSAVFEHERAILPASSGSAQ